MAEQDSLGSLFAARPRLLSTTKKPHDIRPLENKAAQARSSQPAPPQEVLFQLLLRLTCPLQLDDEALERLGLDRQLNPQLAASGAVTPVDSPAVLKLLVRSLLQNSDGEPTTTRISLSGVILIHAQGYKQLSLLWLTRFSAGNGERILTATGIVLMILTVTIGSKSLPSAPTLSPCISSVSSAGSSFPKEVRQVLAVVTTRAPLRSHRLILWFEPGSNMAVSNLWRGFINQ